MHPSGIVDSKFTDASLTWEQASNSLKDGLVAAKIILQDSDANHLLILKEKVTVHVYSDSSPEGINLELYETSKNSGIFERLFMISDFRSTPNILSAQVGDTAIATYQDTTLPDDMKHISVLDLQASTIIDIAPTIVGYARHMDIKDLNGNEINYPLVDQQYTISSDLIFAKTYTENFVFIVQIQNELNQNVVLSWIKGTSNSTFSSDVGISWIPKNAGKYYITSFVWESLTNPTALTPPISTSVEVIQEDESVQCAKEFDLINSIPGCGPDVVCEPKPAIANFIELREENRNFKKLHCADYVGEWAHLTERGSPYRMDIDWDFVSDIHHEIPTFKIHGLNEKFQPVKVQKQIRFSIEYWDVKRCFDAYAKITDNLTGEVVLEKQYQYECKNRNIGVFDRMMLRVPDRDWEINLPGFYTFELKGDTIDITEEFFVECTSGGCEFLSGEDLKGRQKHQGHYDR